MLPGNRPEDIAFDTLIEGPVGDWLLSNVGDLLQLPADRIIHVLDTLRNSFPFCPHCGQLIDKGKGFMGYCTHGCYIMDNSDETRPVAFIRDKAGIVHVHQMVPDATHPNGMAPISTPLCHPTFSDFPDDSDGVCLHCANSKHLVKTWTELTEDVANA